MTSHKSIPPRERTLTPPAHRRTLLLECKSEVVVICRCASHTETGFVAKMDCCRQLHYAETTPPCQLLCISDGIYRQFSNSKCFQVLLQLLKKHACTILHNFLEFSCDNDSCLCSFCMHISGTWKPAASLVETGGKCSKVLFQSRNLMQIDCYFLEPLSRHRHQRQLA